MLIFCCLTTVAQELTISFNYGCFATANDETYLETYLLIPQNGLKHVKNDSGKFSAAAQVTILFKDNDQIVDFLKYELVGNEISDTTNINNNMVDQQRIFLDNKTYLVDVCVKDKNDTTNVVRGEVVVQFNLPKDVVSSSTICFIDSYSKTNEKTMLTRGSYNMIPYFSTFFPETKSKLTYYNEIYNIDNFVGENSRIAVLTYIEDYEKVDNVVEGTSKIQSKTAESILCLFNNIDITTLPTGNYWLVVCVKDEQGNEIIKTKKFFQRYNPEYEVLDGALASVDLDNSFAYKFNSLDTLRQVVHSLMPKANMSERIFINHVDTITDVKKLQQFITMFWNTRDEISPEMAFDNYMEEVKKVNSTYSNSIRRGYDTDRGRVYLQYGPPNHIERNIIPAGSIPYEVWQYYEIAGQRDKRFVFATRDAAIRDYELVHSDVIGELSNPKWQYDLYKNSPIIDDNFEYEEMWGTPLQRTYDNPY